MTLGSGKLYHPQVPPDNDCPKSWSVDVAPCECLAPSGSGQTSPPHAHCWWQTIPQNAVVGREAPAPHPPRVAHPLAPTTAFPSTLPAARTTWTPTLPTASPLSVQRTSVPRKTASSFSWRISASATLQSRTSSSPRQLASHSSLAAASVSSFPSRICVPAWAR